MKYYSLTRIDKKNATYNLIIGERSNGKTYALLMKAIKEYLGNGGQFAYVRRWKEDITGRRGQRLFSALNESGEIERLSKGKFTGVTYWAGRFYLCTYDDKGKAVYNDSDLFGFTFALSDGEHDKSTSFPNITTVIFDEFLTNRLYLNDEFVLFMNTISTIVRRRTDVKIYMLGNTVNKYCPYFQEMGLNNVLKMKQGAIDVYHYGESSLTVAVEYCKSTNTEKSESNKYFAFDNPKLEMITGGAWELSIYPHLPYKYKPKDILLTFFIIFADSIFQCEVIEKKESVFIFIFPKTTPLQSPKHDLIYSLDPSPLPNYNQNIFRPANRVQERVLNLIRHGKVFYQSNDVGDAINNFLKICKGK